MKNKRPLKFYIVYELVTSERDYLGNLDLICSDFRNTLKCNYHRSHWEQEKGSTGKRFESPKKSNLFPVEPFSSKFFYVHIEAVILQKWQTTHFKACSK